MKKTNKSTKHNIPSSALVQNNNKEIKKMADTILEFIKSNEQKDKEYYLKLGSFELELMKKLGLEETLNEDILKEPMLKILEDYPISELFKDGNQFDFNSEKSTERTLEDIVANVMLLSNQLAHRFEIYFDNYGIFRTTDSKPYADYFFQIKDECIDELLRLRDLGRPILVNNFIDNKVAEKMENVYTFALPGYLETFSVHGQPKDKNYPYDTDVDIVRFSGMRETMIPLHISSENYEKIKQAYEKEELGNLLTKRNINRVELFLKVQNGFEQENNQENDKEQKKYINNKLYYLKDSNISSINKTHIQYLFDRIEDELKSPRKMIKTMYEIIEEFGFWEDLLEYENYEVQNDLWNIVNKNHEIGLADDILITKEQLAEQFNPDRKQEVTELFANGMLLANLIVQIIRQNSFKLKDIGIFTKDTAFTFSNIRTFFQNGLIEKSNMRNDKNERRYKILINQQEIDLAEKRKAINVAIPGYTEPFSTILPKNKMEASIEENDSIPYYDTDAQQVLSTFFPIRATKQQRKILELLSQREEVDWSEETSRRIKYFSEVNSRFGEQNNKEEISIKKPGTIKATKPSEKVEKTFEKENSAFLEEENEKLGNIIPVNIIKEILKNTTYSLRDTYEKKFKTIIQDELSKKGISKEQLDSESNKVYLYMRMCKSLSTIRLLGRNNPTLKETIVAAISEYERAFEEIENILKNKDGEIKLSRIKKEVEIRLENNQIEEESLENEPIEEIQDREEDIETKDRYEGISEEQDILEEQENEEESGNEEKTENVEEQDTEYLIKKIEEFIDKLKELKDRQRKNKKELEELKELLANNNSVNKAKEEAIIERMAHSKRIEELKEKRREIEEAIAAEEAKEQESEQKVKDLSKKAKKEKAQNSNIESQIRKKEEEQRQIERDLEEMQRKQDSINDLFK